MGTDQPDQRSYVLSYWKKNGTGWDYIQSTVNVTGGAYTISGITGQIDDLRFYPADAQMITYTYDLLKGLSAQSDANNMVTYYEYDSPGRLSNVRDADKNLLQHVDYHFKP